MEEIDSHLQSCIPTLVDKDKDKDIDVDNRQLLDKVD